MRRPLSLSLAVLNKLQDEKFMVFKYFESQCYFQYYVIAYLSNFVINLNHEYSRWIHSEELEPAFEVWGSLSHRHSYLTTLTLSPSNDLVMRAQNALATLRHFTYTPKPNRNRTETEPKN